MGVGRKWVRDRLPLKDLLHATAPGGNSNNADQACLPASAPSGWEIDRDPPDFGIVYGGENHNNYGRIVPPDANNQCLTAYADGRDGNAHQNIQDVRMKVIKLVDQDECNPKWTSDPIALQYGRLTQPDVHERQRAASAGVCEEARARAIPASHIRVEFLDGSTNVIERTADLVEGTEATALDGAVKVKLNANGQIDFNLAPQCVWRVVPAGQ